MRCRAEAYREHLPPGDFGQVALRHAVTAAAVMTDGHTESLGQRELQDMRRRGNRLESRDDGLIPRDGGPQPRRGAARVVARAGAGGRGAGSGHGAPWTPRSADAWFVSYRPSPYEPE